MNALEAALYSRITGGTAITNLLAGTTSAFSAVVPRGESFPAIVWSLQAGGDANETPRRRRDLRYLVKAIAATSMKDAGAIDDQIDLALTGVPLTITGWTNFALTREETIRYAETTPEGRNYWHAGGVYRLRLNPT